VTRNAILALEGNSLDELSRLASNARLTVVLSNHFVRYALLPWSDALGTEEEWCAYAEHAFLQTYGSVAAEWHLHTSPAGRDAPRIACAVDRALFDSLRAVPGVVSIQPYLMAAFNARRRVFGKGPGWFVLQETGRVALGLIAGGEWKSIRVRQIRDDPWEALPGLLDREREIADAPECDAVVVWAEREPPARAGRYRIADATLRPGAPIALRECAMALN
jgi:hypothetical protein